MRLNVVLTFLACLVLASSSNIEDQSMRGMQTVLTSDDRSIMNDIAQAMGELKNTRRSSYQRCVWKICSKPIKSPVLIDHLKAAFKKINKWSNNLFVTKHKTTGKMNRNKYRITDFLINRN